MKVKIDIRLQRFAAPVHGARNREHFSFISGRKLFYQLIRPNSINRDTEIRSQQKVYVCDTGMMNRFARFAPLYYL
jgi:hypothetical protein